MKKFKVFVTRMLPGSWLEKLSKIADVEYNHEDRILSRDELKKGVKEKDGLISLLTDKIDAEIMDESTKLKVVSNYAVGYDNIDVKSATERGIYVTNTPDVLTETVADLTLSLILGIGRRIVEADNYLRTGLWKGWEPELLLGNDIYNKTLGIIGLGKIGTAVAKRASGFNMKILYYDMFRNEKVEKDIGLKFLPMEQVLQESDFITIHVPLLPSTYHLIGTKQLGMMKNTAYLINTSRGGVIDEKALISALEERKIAGAGLDVFEKEPIETNNKLIKLKNTILLPHVASGTIETRINMANLAVECVISVLQGKMPPVIVNKDVIKIRQLNN